MTNELDTYINTEKIPLWGFDKKARVGYLTVDPTQLVHHTAELPTDPDSGVTLLADYDEYGNILGIEVLA